ncbi:hypothetical protein PAXINDRAFT_19251 [Paxillus involutus ATCC 200175]|uniref:Uncharacterized protein n=1 Tax=Paxillus involutus ATCC 200175 TaxID=664439 RepID=A0A0C9T8V8_PAXIN|nr:hypothetical protein PAXINDRAFT_19251 [Paxillus involutus ATCC 200175]
MFSFSTLNITTDRQFEEYIRTYLFLNVTSIMIQEVMQYYPANISQGSPIDTSTLNALTPQFKRIAALQGDVNFQAPRRFFLQNRSGKQALWTYVSKRLKTGPLPRCCKLIHDLVRQHTPRIPICLQFHGSDISNVYGGQDMASYLVRFFSNLDPNGGTDLYWPQYTTVEPDMLEFLGGSIPHWPTEDTYRADAMAYPF